ncbi:hypothetical protein B0T18DRAFT_423504 [Schizothecium vesticola]|uniref:Uncharacterized protein n=1 Tax=Schizothecium vesticola TaxID=314040 RepID=A0AA40F7V9_9PEZI|nr:hypothetical protein B0T18DRAFT_423504 [Schizothecium vesticola]
MQFSLKDIAFLVLPLLASGAALPATVDTNAAVNATGVAPLAAQRCRVNSSHRDLWVEDGMSRWRTVFSAEGTDPAGYCHYWVQHGCGFNVQCGWDANVDGGWWRLDVSIARGPLGDQQYWDCLGGTRAS